MFTISLCMIVKNENQTLARVLSCAKKFSDEIIIVDTGSTDNTKEIARSFTNNIFDFKWNNDFAAARNYSFEKATCDYQMWLDADDFISNDDIEKIRALKTSTASADVFMFNYAINFDENNAPSFVFSRERLLKRSCNFKWQGFVHEAIAVRGIVEQCNITIQHRKEKASDPKRNLKIYQLAKRNGVDFNPREQYYYSRELYYNGHICCAIKNLKKFLNQNPTFPPDIIGAHLLLSECFKQKSQYDKAIDILFDCIKQFPPTAEICCKIAELFEIQQKSELAIIWYNFALICPKQTQGFVQKDYEVFIPNLQLCRLYYAKKDFAKAKLCHETTKKVRRNHPSTIFNEQFFC